MKRDAIGMSLLPRPTAPAGAGVEAAEVDR